jgi:iron complex outermembrane receptor protein
MPLLKKITLLLIFIFFNLPIFAQNVIRGKVVDAETGEIIVGVSIRNRDTVLITWTNGNGEFILQAETTQEKEYIFTFVGYKSVLVKLKSQNESYLIKLQPDYNIEDYVDYSYPLLSEIKVTGYANNRPLSEVPAAISVIKSVELQRFSNTSLVQAVSAVPGVRMEERSPGSYRLSIRGSTLRSPFGVRNVKMYWNEIPFTDANGNTYLNLLDFNNVPALEIIKGPGGSLYGAGTGGVVLIRNQQAENNTSSFTIGSLAGSYGLFGSNAIWQTASKKVNSTLSFAHQESNGYREQSRMRRDVLNWQSRFFVSNRRTLNANVLYADLYYQTPGGLTRVQMEQNPQQARPAGGGFRSAADQQAAIFNKTFLLGLSQEYDFNRNWTNKTAIYVAFTQFENPAIRNYERKTEQHLGARTTTIYQFNTSGYTKGKITFGGEFQKGMTYDKNYGNRLGLLDTLQTDDEIPVWGYLVFAQAELDLPANFYLTLGGSFNRSQINFQRLYKPASARQERSFSPVLLPRIALLNKLADNFSIFGSVSAGYSPPTVAEVRPSEGSFNPNLNPEKGISYEVGFRGNLLNGDFEFDVTSYLFRLNETIVIRRAADGSDFYNNAGKTSQKGVETSLAYRLLKTNNGNTMKIWTSFTYNDYRFKDYLVRTADYSGNWLTGVPHSVVVSGLDINMNFGFYANVVFNYTDKIVLNDANTEFATGYKLLGTKIGYRRQIFNKIEINCWSGIDNAFDERYSLGNDLNATGNRFFNPAAGRNYYGGIKLSLKF